MRKNFPAKKYPTIKNFCEKKFTRIFFKKNPVVKTFARNFFKKVKKKITQKKKKNSSEKNFRDFFFDMIISFDNGQGMDNISKNFC